ncbi:MAG TPA: cytochrome c [Bryobacteraceae bacterium]|nr:cytochrome c [Bryobacteraceae bacterium]
MKVKIKTMAIIGLAAAGAFYSNLRAQSPSRSVWDGVYTDAQAKSGQPMYNESCSSCHGDTLMGGESAPALAGGEFLSNWNGLTLGDLFDRIRTTMPQNKPQSLSRDKVAGILAYMLSVNQFPAGKTELPQQTEVLKEIRIDASKPDHK